MLAVVDAIVTGFFLGATLFEYLHGHDVWTWIWPLLMAFTGIHNWRGNFGENGRRSVQLPALHENAAV